MRCCPKPIIAASTARDNNVSGGYDLDLSAILCVVAELITLLLVLELFEGNLEAAVSFLRL